MKLSEHLMAPVDAASLCWFRIAFGVLLGVECLRYLAFGWVTDYWVEPSFHFTYYGFEWVAPWPGPGMYVHFAAVALLAFCMAAGFRFRAAAALFTIGFAYVFLLEQAQYLNHFYAVILFSGLLTLMPAAADCSIDARQRPQTASRSVPIWTIWALRAQMGFIYAWGGIAKLNADWLSGQPLTMWLQANERLPEFLKGDAGLWLSWAGAGFDLLIVPALIWRRTQTAAVLVAIAFHLTNAWIFDIGVFPWMSIAATLLFLEPDHPLFANVLAPLRRASEVRIAPLKWPVGVVLAIWLTSQLVMPLRPFIYGNHVHWTEDGHRFSWHMKLRSKECTGYFWVQRDGEASRERVDPLEHLTERQYHKMLARPDMVLQYAHFLAAKGGPGTQVYAQIFASLNGRDPATLTDVNVDLAQQRRTLSPPTWVVPFEDTPLDR